MNKNIWGTERRLLSAPHKSDGPDALMIEWICTAPWALGLANGLQSPALLSVLHPACHSSQLCPFQTQCVFPYLSSWPPWDLASLCSPAQTWVLLRHKSVCVHAFRASAGNCREVEWLENPGPSPEVSMCLLNACFMFSMQRAPKLLNYEIPRSHLTSSPPNHPRNNSIPFRNAVFTEPHRAKMHWGLQR